MKNDSSNLTFDYPLIPPKSPEIGHETRIVWQVEADEILAKVG